MFKRKCERAQGAEDKDFATRVKVSKITPTVTEDSEQQSEVDESKMHAECQGETLQEGSL